METKRTLVVARHATAESFAADDHARRLTARGEEEARLLGDALVALDVTPDGAIVSDAARTKATWAGLRRTAEEAGQTWHPHVDETRAVYTADEGSLLQLIRECDASLRSLIVVGHNPTVASLALLLEDGDGDSRAAAEMLTGFSPACAAVFTVTGEWRDLSYGAATLRAYVSPHRG